MGLVDDALAGSDRAVARLASMLENDQDAGRAALERLYPLGGRARTIGVTGPPGAGKSTLIDRLVASWRSRDQRVAVIAVDPSSPLTGGALLGDRVRMLRFHDDPGVFVRSMASRGRAGGVAPATASLIHLFDAAGYDVVLVETVGIGQEEVDVVNVVETVAVVQVPGLGDGVQALKAGVLEVADVFVVNKADLAGADDVRRQIRAVLELSSGDDSGWRPPVLAVSSSTGSGVDALVEALDAHAGWLRDSGALADRRRAMARAEIAAEARRMLERRFWGQDPSTGAAVEAVANVAARRVTPHRAAVDLLAAGQGG